MRRRSTGASPGAAPASSIPSIWWKWRARAAIADSGALSRRDSPALKKWFAEYITWMTTSKNGIEERDAKNNHGTCWVMQVAAFARYAGNGGDHRVLRESLQDEVSFQSGGARWQLPAELARTKPYGYSLFNLEAMSTLSQILNLWDFTLPDGRGMAKALAYMYPFIEDKTKWPLKPDVMYFDQWPVRQESLLFGGLAYRKPEYLALWRKLKSDPTVEETIRNYPIRQPVLWLT